MDFIFTILCAIAGIGLIILEAFMPGFGLPGLTGIILDIVAIVIAYVHHGPVVALITGLITLSVIAIVLSFVLRSATKGKLAKSKMILHDVENKDNGFVASDDTKVFIGREGETKGVLRPTGIADFDGVRLNVVSEGDFISSGTRVRIIEAEGSRIVVRPV